MATFTLKIDCDNAAFKDNPAPELARILRQIAGRLDTVAPDKRGDLNYTDSHGGWFGHFQTVRDSHGNDVGRYALKAQS